MLKDRNIFENLKQVFENSGRLNAFIFKLVTNCSVNHVQQDCRTLINRKSLIHWMLTMKFLGLSTVSRFKTSEWGNVLKFGKDVLYKVKNNPLINWRRLLLSHALQCMKKVELEKENDVSSVPCFIIDDTDIPKTGKRIEWIGRIFSHVNRGYNLGFKSLNLAYWSGKHLLHIDFSLHLELGKKKNQGMKSKDLRSRFTKQRSKESFGHKRIEELVEKKNVNAIKMIRRAIRKGVKASYILADSWFFNTALAKFAIKEKVHLISRPKFNNWKYEYKGKPYTIGQLVKKVRYSEKAKWNRHLRLRFVTISVKFQGIEMNLYLFKDKKRGSKWHAIISTEKKLSAQRAFKIYQTRWTIETSFKELKQLFNFGKCKSRDFDGQISDATLCLMSYNLLSHIKAVEDHQSIGQLFHEVSQQWLKPTMMTKFWKAFYDAIKELSELICKPVIELIDIFIKESKLFNTLQKFNALLTTET